MIVYFGKDEYHNVRAVRLTRPKEGTPEANYELAVSMRHFDGSYTSILVEDATDVVIEERKDD